MPLVHWLTRDADIHAATHAPYRELEEIPALSHGDRDTGNLLIQGDNLDALKALLPYYDADGGGLRSPLIRTAKRLSWSAAISPAGARSGFIGS